MEDYQEKIKLLFEEKPYLRRMGAKKISKRYNIPIDEIKLFRSPKNNQRTPRILIFDIETSPMIGYIWRLFKENIGINRVTNDWYILSWSGKWLNGPIFTDYLTSDEAKKEDDSRIVKSLWHMIDQADIVIAHNAKGFDIPRMNTRFILNGLNPPSFYKIIDTLDVAKRVFGFDSNKLDWLAMKFDIPTKLKTDFDLWRECMQGNDDALKYMNEYNIYDVEILEQVYLRLRPWIPSHPNSNIYNISNDCPYCGNKHMYESGEYFTNSNRYRAFRCSKCGALSRMREGQLTKNEESLTSIPK